MKAVKALTFVFVVIALSVGMGWLYRTQLIQSSVPYLLQERLNAAGVKNLSMTVAALGRRSAFISSLQFEFELTQANAIKMLYQVDLKGIQLDYDEQVLINDATLESVAVKTITVQASTLAGGDALAADSRDKNRRVAAADVSPLQAIAGAVEAFRRDWRESIPVRHVQLSSVSLSGEPFAALDGQSYRLVFSQSSQPGKDLALQLTPLASGRPVALTSRSSEVLSLVIDTDAPAASLELDIQGEAIKAQYRLQPGRLSQWLHDSGFSRQADLFQSFVAGPVDGTFSLPLSMLSDNPGKTLAMFSLATPSFKAGSLSLDRIEAGVLFRLFAREGETQLEIAPKSFLRYREARFAQTTVRGNEIRLQGALGLDSAARYSATFVTDFLHVVHPLADGKRIETDINKLLLAVTAENNTVKFEATFEPSVLPGVFKAGGEHRLKAGAGRLTLRTVSAIDFSGDETRLSAVLTPWPYAFDVVSGEAGLEATMQWQSTGVEDITVTLKLKDVGGFYNELVFSGLNTKQVLSLFPQIKTVTDKQRQRIGQTGLIRLDHLDAGVLLHDIHLQLALRPPSEGDIPAIEVHNLEAHVFDGRFFSNAFTLDFNRPQNRLQLDVRDIDLARVAETQQFSGFSITGRLDGKLPVELNADGAFVQDGHFDNAGRSGYIRYRPETGTQQLEANPLSEIALKALRDFRYSELDVDLSYVPDGTLALNFHMKGVSPELGSKQAVNLNINTQQNVKALLKSLRYAEGLNKNIDARVRKKYN